MVDIVAAQATGGHRVHLRFDDGVEGEIDLALVIAFDGVFASLRDPAQFARLRVHPELGTIVWPGGADLDPDVLHARLTGKPMAV